MERRPVAAGVGEHDDGGPRPGTGGRVQGGVAGAVGCRNEHVSLRHRTSFVGSITSMRWARSWHPGARDRRPPPAGLSRLAARDRPERCPPVTAADPLVLREDADGVATLTLNRPDK